MNRHEFDRQLFVFTFQDGVPNVILPVVFRATHRADINQMLVMRQPAMPLDTGMRRRNDVSIKIPAE